MNKKSVSSEKDQLSREKEFVQWTPTPSIPNTMDSGEQPGWTKLKWNCGKIIRTRNDAKLCLEDYKKTWTVNWGVEEKEIRKDFIIVKHEKQDDTDTPILSGVPTIKPYKIEVFQVKYSYAVDWEGNIYYFQSWA